MLWSPTEMGEARSDIAAPAPALAAALVVSVVLVAGCASAPPSQPDQICSIFREKSGWYKDAKRAQKRWGMPISVGMAFVYKESSYRSDARPERERLLWVVPWRRPSSAYGYAQITDAAWREYLDDTRGFLRERDDFGTALDFVGWYNDRSHRRLGIAKNDAYNLYLAYYVGHGGYKRGHHRKKPEVRRYARRVSEKSKRYAAQLSRCEKEFRKPWWRPI